jgi:hypothetical protein
MWGLALVSRDMIQRRSIGYAGKSWNGKEAQSGESKLGTSVTVLKQSVQYPHLEPCLPLHLVSPSKLKLYSTSHSDQ